MRLAFRGLTFRQDARGAVLQALACVGQGQTARSAVENSRAPSLFSNLATALETVALDRSRSLAARTKERSSAILAKIASPSRSGSFGIFGNDKFLKFPFMSRSCTLFNRHATAPSMARRVRT